MSMKVSDASQNYSDLFPEDLGFSEGLERDFEVYYDIFGSDMLVNHFHNNTHEYIIWAANKCEELGINPYEYTGMLGSGSGSGGRSRGRGRSRGTGQGSTYNPLASGRAGVGSPAGSGSRSPSGSTYGQHSSGRAGVGSPAGSGSRSPSSSTYDQINSSQANVGTPSTASHRVPVSPTYDPLSSNPIASGNPSNASTRVPSIPTYDSINSNPLAVGTASNASSRNYTPWQAAGGSPTTGEAIYKKIFDTANFPGFRWPNTSVGTKTYCEGSYRWDQTLSNLGLWDLLNFDIAIINYNGTDMKVGDLIKVDSNGSLDKKGIATAGRTRVILGLFNELWDKPDSSIEMGTVAKQILVDLRDHMKHNKYNVRNNNLQSDGSFGFEGQGRNAGSSAYFINFEYLDPNFRSNVIQNANNAAAVKQLLPMNKYEVRQPFNGGQRRKFSNISQTWESDQNELMTVPGLIQTIIDKFKNNQTEYDSIMKYLEDDLKWISPIYPIIKDPDDVRGRYRIVDLTIPAKHVYDRFDASGNEKAPLYVFPLFGPKDKLTGNDLSKVGLTSAGNNRNLNRNEIKSIENANSFHDSFITGDFVNLLDIILRKLK